MGATYALAMSEARGGNIDSGEIALQVRGISKRFGVTQALQDVSIDFRAGEVHALMGENGAGKSTLGKTIAGLHLPDAGSITLFGRGLKVGDIDDAFGAGVRIVHQELAQCPNLSVAENLCLHDLPTRAGMVDRAAMNRRAAVLLKDLAPEIDVEAPLGTLAPGRRQIVQIASALDEGTIGRKGGKGVGAAKHPPRVIIFDEPTSSLSIAEAERLAGIIRGLAARGLIAIYVSHRMGEIFACCDRVSVLRDGKFVATSEVKAITEGALVSQMIGRAIEGGQAWRSRRAEGVDEGAAAALTVRGLNSPEKLRDINLEVRPGEVLGVGGLVGSGRSELLDAVFGLDPQAHGSVRVESEELPSVGARERIVRGVGYVPEDRRVQGLFFQLGIDENIAIPQMPLLARGGVRTLEAERALVRARVKEFQIKAASAAALPGELSGGNQQKLLIARWLDRGTRVLLLDEPTRGIDVGTKTEIHRLVRDAAEAGLAVLLVSSEMPELLALSDRIVVMCDGRITGELRAEAMTQENILRLAVHDDAASAASVRARRIVAPVGAA
ncbi:sugar ABC transporter ATP-binding protein [soil metagenome]